MQRIELVHARALERVGHSVCRKATPRCIWQHTAANKALGQRVLRSACWRLEQRLTNETVRALQAHEMNFAELHARTEQGMTAEKIATTASQQRPQQHSQIKRSLHQRQRDPEKSLRLLLLAAFTGVALAVLFAAMRKRELL